MISQTSQDKIRSTTVVDFIANVNVVISFNRNPDHLRYAKFYRKLIERQDARDGEKVVLITTVGLKEFLVGFFYLLSGGQVFHVIHDFIPHPGPKYKITVLYNSLASLFFKLVFHSRSQAERYGKECHVFPLPITSLPESVIRSSGPFLAFGRCEPYKNFDHIVHLANSFKEFDFVIASKGYVSNCKPPNLKIIDTFVTDEELRILMQRCRALVLPYTSATQSGVIVQAFEYGKPVIVSDVPGLVEYLGEESWFGESFSLQDDSSFKIAAERIVHQSSVNFQRNLNRWNSKMIL